MKKIINNIEFTTIKAIAAVDSANDVQDALLMHDIEDEFCDGDCIVFGYEMPEDEADVDAIIGDPSSMASAFTVGADCIYRAE